MSTISVIIVNWNGKHLLAGCLNSLRLQTVLASEIFVVDNGSHDGSQAMIDEQYPEVTLIALSVNEGFSIANNIGIRRAMGDYIALLNNDVQLDREWLECMAAALDDDFSLGSCASKMLFYDRRDIINAAGDSLLTNGIGVNRGRFQLDSDQFQSPMAVFGACAGAAMYRSSMLQDIGLFDEDLYMYCEDVDLSFRAQLANYNCLYVPGAIAYHHHSASDKASNKTFSTKDYYVIRNTLLVIVKNMPASLLRRHLFQIIIGQLPYALQAGMKGEIVPYAHTCFDALCMLPNILRKRRRVQRMIRRDVVEIAARLTNPSVAEL